MKKIITAIIGYGNIGRSVLEAIQAAEDMELSGIVIRDKSTAAAKGIPPQLTVVEDIVHLPVKPDVAFLCLPSRTVPAMATAILGQGINTVDSYDIHSTIHELNQQLAPIAQKNNAVAIIAAGWDPGTDSIVRCMLEAAAPKGLTYTNFGPGMSMGHTVAVKAIDGVHNALSVTIPKGTGLHRRMVYIELAPGAVEAEVAAAIKADPYFVNDETYVTVVDSVDQLKDMGHGVDMVRKGVSGTTDNQLFNFTMTVNNPALTAQIMVSSGRATTRQAPGSYTMIEIPLIDLLPGEREGIIRRMV